MYIRKVKKRNGRSDKIFEYLYLVENVRTVHGPRQRLILNLGNMELDPSEWTTFVNAVEARLTGQQTILELDTHLEKPVNQTVHQIIKKRSQELKKENKRDFQMVDIASIEGENHRSPGAEHVCHSIWKELEISTYLENQGINQNNCRLIEALVLGRLIDPGSELYTKKWVEQRSALFDLTGTPYQPSLSSYYRAGDKLYKIKDKLENYLRNTEQKLFNLEERIILYDLSNSHFEGQMNSNKKAKYGRSKQKRSDCKLLTLGLVLDHQGFAKHSKLYEGNITEPKTLKEILLELNPGKSVKKQPIVVIDAGIATGENVDWLKENGYGYIVVNRAKAPIERDYTDMQIIKKDDQKGIEIKVKRYEKNKEAYLLCWSKQRQAKENGIRSRQEQLFLEQLNYYKNGLKVKRRTKKYTKILELIGRLRQKYPKASNLYEIEVTPEKDLKVNNSKILATDIIWEKRNLSYEDAIQKEGSYILRTNQMAISDQEIWEIYVMLTRIESAFKSMKSHLGLRPVFHQLEKRCDAHLFISVLAYHILHIVEYRLRQKGDHRNWQSIRNVLSTQQRFTISFCSKNTEGKIISQFIKTNSIAEPAHLEIYRALNIAPPKLVKQKTTNPTKHSNAKKVVTIN